MNNFVTYCRITFWRIIKSKSTEQFSGIPYAMTLLNCLLSAWYIIYASYFINRVLFNFYCFFSSFVTFFYPYSSLFLTWIMCVFNYYYYGDDNDGDFIGNSC